MEPKNPLETFNVIGYNHYIINCTCHTLKINQAQLYIIERIKALTPLDGYVKAIDVINNAIAIKGYRLDWFYKSVGILVQRGYVERVVYMSGKQWSGKSYMLALTRKGNEAIELYYNNVVSLQREFNNILNSLSSPAILKKNIPKVVGKGKPRKKRGYNNTVTGLTPRQEALKRIKGLREEAEVEAMIVKRRLEDDDFDSLFND